MEEIYDRVTSFHGRRLSIPLDGYDYPGTEEGISDTAELEAAIKTELALYDESRNNPVYTHDPAMFSGVSVEQTPNGTLVLEYTPLGTIETGDSGLPAEEDSGMPSWWNNINGE
ncbi:MAG: hypothetical protein SVY41_02340 [Candidatus Nanohaloarchaea archaeon]|nr:hypothetical protein [Candidatus Nanohaloarchaea archaeon]